MGNLARDVLFRMRAQDYTFCLLIVRYMLSDKIKGKSALKARTFLHEHDKKIMYVIGLVSTENSAGSNVFKTLHWQMFTYNQSEFFSNGH